MSAISELFETYYPNALPPGFKLKKCEPDAHFWIQGLNKHTVHLRAAKDGLTHSDGTGVPTKKWDYVTRDIDDLCLLAPSGRRLKPKVGMQLHDDDGALYLTHRDYNGRKSASKSLIRKFREDFGYPDVTDRVYHPDGSLKGGKYRDVRVMVSAKDNPNAPRTQTVFNGDKPAVIHINSRQAIDPAMSWYHEIAHIEEPEGRGPDRARAELVADRHGCRMTGKSRDDYKRWVLARDSSGDSPAHIAARLELCNNFSKHMSETYPHYPLRKNCLSDYEKEKKRYLTDVKHFLDFVIKKFPDRFDFHDDDTGHEYSGHEYCTYKKDKKSMTALAHYIWDHDGKVKDYYIDNYLD